MADEQAALYALAGALTGGMFSLLVTIFTLRSQRKGEIEREKRQDETKRAERALVQRAAAANECLLLVEQLRRIGPQIHKDRMKSTSTRESIDEWYEALEELERRTVELPPAEHERLATLMSLLRNAGDLSADSPYGIHYLSVFTIVDRTADHAREMLNAFLRGDPVPPPPEHFIEDKGALELLYEEKRLDLIDEIAEGQERHESCLEEHPEIKSQIEDHRRQHPKAKS